MRSESDRFSMGKLSTHLEGAGFDGLTPTTKGASPHLDNGPDGR